MERFYEIMHQSKDEKTVLAIDCMNRDEILAYLRKDEKHRNRFRTAAQLILERTPNREIYKWEKISDEIKNVWAIRFFVHGDNDRIYCQEIWKGDKKTVVMSNLLRHKTSNANSPREISAITEVSGHDYKLRPTDNQEIKNKNRIKKNDHGRKKSKKNKR